MWYGYLTVKISANNYSKTISEIENKWKEFTANKPLEYYFVDEDFEQMYIQEKQNAQMAVIFSILAIFIASLGLFGLTSFTVEQRTKEIGVRKAMGSSVTGIYIVISKEVIILVSISAFIACPVIYYIAGKWLRELLLQNKPWCIQLCCRFDYCPWYCYSYNQLSHPEGSRVNPAQSLKYE